MDTENMDTDTLDTEMTDDFAQEDAMQSDTTDDVTLDDVDTDDDNANVAPVIVNGISCTPATHVFRNGSPVLKKDGTPKLKPGRKTGISPHKKSTSTASNEDKVPASVNVVDAVQASSTEVRTTPAASIAQVQALVEQSPKIQREVTASVQRSFGKIGASEAEDTTLSVRTFVTAPATVELGYGLTLNIGNYESARVDVKVSVPCYREEVDAAYAWAREWAENRIRKEVTEIKNMATDQKATHF